MKRYLPVVLAVVVAAIAAGMVFFYTQGAEQRVLNGQQAQSVLVSTAIVPQGMSISEAVSGGLAEQTQVPSDMTPDGSIPSVTADNGALVAFQEVAPGQILLAANFGTELPKAVSVPVPDGQIAVSLTLGDPQRVGTFVRPGSEVVIFNTYQADPVAGGVSDTGGVATRTLLDRVTVLAVGDATTASTTNADGTVSVVNADGTTSTSAPSALLTVSVNQAQAEKLIHGINTGNLYLGLLGEGTEIAKIGETTNANLFD